VVTWTPPTFTDNCGRVIVTSNYKPGDFFSAECEATAKGTLVTYKATDEAGNTTTCSFRVTVLDTEAPVVRNCPADIVVKNDPGVCGAVVKWVPPAFTDNCTVVSVTSNHKPGESFPAECQATARGTIVTYTAIDECGNATTCSFKVTILDTEAPVITIKPLASKYFSTDVAALSYTVTDNCDTTPTVTVKLSNNGWAPVDITAPSPIPLDLPNLVGKNTISVTATDDCGNTSTATVEFKVVLKLVGKQIVIKDEVQKMGSTTFIATVQFPAPYDALTVYKAVADGAPATAFNHDWVAHSTICKFNRADVTEIPIDDYFEVTGLFTYKGVTCEFFGADSIYRVLPPPRTPIR